MVAQGLPVDFVVGEELIWGEGVGGWGGEFGEDAVVLEAGDVAHE